jgi:hypothetical protein
MNARGRKVIKIVTITTIFPNAVLWQGISFDFLPQIMGYQWFFVLSFLAAMDWTFYEAVL